MLTDEIAVMVERLTAFANGCRGSMWQSRNETIELCDEAAATITALRAEVAALREALEPLARLEPPSKPQGNAGFYSIYHKHIIAARAARGGQA